MGNACFMRDDREYKGRIYVRQVKFYDDPRLRPGFSMELWASFRDWGHWSRFRSR
jgi:hypothetical protein